MAGRLIVTIGDGGSGFNPFNLSQDDMEIAGQMILMLQKHFICLDANIDQTRLFLGVYGSIKVNDYNLGAIMEIIP